MICQRIHTILGYLNGNKDILICTTSLSNFIKGRYSPYLRWIGIWKGILKHLGLNIELSWQSDIEFMHKSDAHVTKKTTSQHSEKTVYGHIIFTYKNGR